MYWMLLKGNCLWLINYNQCPGNISTLFSRYSEVYASEYLENHVEMLPRYMLPEYRGGDTGRKLFYFYYYYSLNVLNNVYI